MAGNDTTHLFDLQQVYPPEGHKDDTTVDIIAIHGLETRSLRTWVAYETGDAGAPRGRAVNWLCDTDMLPSSIPESRIFTFDYDANFYDEAPVETLLGHADNLLSLLAYKRKSNNSVGRPLLFIASCFGGLVLAEALNRAAQNESPYQGLLLSTVGVIFLGTPLRGSRAAPAAQWRVIVGGILGKQVSDKLVRDLDGKTGVLEHLVQIFAENANASWLRLPIHCFYETQPTEILRSVIPSNWARRLSNSYTNRVLVEKEAACLDGFERTGLNARHVFMNKFRGPEDTNFKRVSNSLRELVDGAQKVLDYRANHWSSTSTNVHWSIPRIANTFFTGRIDVLAKIKDALRHEHEASSLEQQRRFVITGLGGQGKSEICLKIADLMRKNFWGVFWVDVSSTSIAKSDFIALAKMLGYSVESIDDARQVLANTKKSWLLILDNADDLEFDYQMYFPSGTHGVIIMTSRVSECSRYNTIGSEVLLSLGPEDSRELFLKAAEIPADSWPSCSSDATRIVNVLGSHTLALIQAGAYIARGHCELREYPELYQQQRRRLLTFFPKQAQSRYRDVYATFEASAKVLELSTGQPAKDALCLLEVLSMLHSNNVPVNIFEEAWKGSRLVYETNHAEMNDLGALSKWHVSQLPDFLSVESNRWDPFRFQEASHLLVSLSLVNSSTQPGLRGLSMHPLTHAWAKDRLDLEKQEQAWINAGSIFASHYDGSFQTWQKHGSHLRAHINFFVDSKPERTSLCVLYPMVLQMLLKCGWILCRLRDDSRLAQLLDSIFRELQADLKNVSVEKLPLYYLTARNQYSMGQIQEAIKLLEQVVNIRKNTLAEDHPDRLASQHALAIAYLSNGQIKEAIKLLEQVVNIQKNTLTEDHPDLLTLQHVLAMAYRSNGQIKEAVKLLEQVVNIRKNTLAEDHSNRLASQHELAIAYRSNGQIKEAIKLLEQVVNIRKNTLAEDHPDRLASQYELSIAYLSNGQIKEAVKLLEQIVNIQKNKLAKDHPDRLASQYGLAIAYRSNGQIKEAVKLIEQVVNIQKNKLAEDHPNRLASQYELSITYLSNGQIKEAVKLLEQIVNIQKNTLAEDHPDRLASRHGLAMAYGSNGQIKEAVKLLKQVVNIRKNTLAEDHPNRLTSQHALAMAYRSNGQIKEAVKLLEQVVNIRKNKLAEDHPDRLASQHELAIAYRSNGQIKEAVKLLEQVVNIRKNTLAEDHPNRLASQHALAGAYRANGQIKKVASRPTLPATKRVRRE